MARYSMYVDGWNFYWSLVNAGIKPYGWCDFALLARNAKVVSPADDLKIKYFTAQDYNFERTGRQRDNWWAALEILGIDVVKGEYRRRREEADPNEQKSGVWREKQTDIRLAIQAITDLMVKSSDGAVTLTGYDTAIVLSGDLDFVPLADTLADLGKRVRVLLPPNEPESESNIQGSWRQSPRPRCFGHRGLSFILIGRLPTLPHTWRVQYHRG